MRAHRELAYGLGEFRRQVAYALRGWKWRWADDGLSIVAHRDDGAVLTLIVEERPARRLSALLAIPCSGVLIEARSMTPDAWGAFLAHFDRAFQRGGG